jgi:hypothetical protein
MWDTRKTYVGMIFSLMRGICLLCAALGVLFIFATIADQTMALGWGLELRGVAVEIGYVLLAVFFYWASAR